MMPSALPPIEPRLLQLRRFYRRFRPIPKSSNPQTDEQIYATNLVPLERLRRRFAETLAYLQTRHGRVLGDYLEFGVYNGASMTCMHKALHDVEATGPRLIGFDSFQGLPAQVVNEDGGVWREGQFSCPPAITERRLRDNGIDPMNDVTFVRGWYKDTLTPETIAALSLVEASVVMIDCDAYSSAQRTLEFIRPLIRSETFVFFDDWRLNDLDLADQGEYRAFHEFRRAYPDIEWRDFGGYNRKSKILLAQRVAADATTTNRADTSAETTEAYDTSPLIPRQVAAAPTSG